MLKKAIEEEGSDAIFFFLDAYWAFNCITNTNIFVCSFQKYATCVLDC